MKNRILMIRTSSGFSGAENYNLTLAKELFKKKYNIRIEFITDNLKFHKRLIDLKIKSHLLKIQIREVGTKKEFFNAFLISPLLIVNYLKIINQIKNDGQIKTVIFQSMTEKIFLTLVLRFLNYEIIWLEHGPLFITDRFVFVKILYRIQSRMATKIIAVSEDTRRDLNSNGIDSKKVNVISPGIDVKYFDPQVSNKNKIKKRLMVEDRLVIGYSGGITKEKGIDELLEIVRYISDKISNTLFMMVGAGPYVEHAKKTAKDWNIDKNIIFTGYKENVRDYLSVMDVFLFPTKHKEGLSVSLIEAAAMELLIVAHDIGGNGEIILNNVTGFLYKNLDLVQILNIITNYNSYAKLRKNARLLVIKKFKIENTAEQFSRLIDN